MLVIEERLALGWQPAGHSFGYIVAGYQPAISLRHKLAWISTDKNSPKI